MLQRDHRLTVDFLRTHRALRREPRLALAAVALAPGAHSREHKLTGTFRANYNLARMRCRRETGVSELRQKKSPWSSRTTAHDSGADVDRYSYIARDLHSLLLAGLPALRSSGPLSPR